MTFVALLSGIAAENACFTKLIEPGLLFSIFTNRIKNLYACLQHFDDIFSLRAIFCSRAYFKGGYTVNSLDVCNFLIHEF